MIRFLRVFFVGGVIAYRALFNWIRPSTYIPTMLGGPVFQIVFFTKLGQYARAQDTAFYVLGNAVQVSAMAAIYGMTMAIANERQFRTLAPLLASPANRAAIFLGRGIPVIANGLVVSCFSFAVAVGMLGFRPPAATLPALAVVLVVTVSSCTALGMLLGSIGLGAKDVFFVSNLAYFLMLLLCGVNVPLSALPGWMEAIGRALPLTHGIMAAREVAAGASLAGVSGLVWTELGIGAAYAAAAYLLFRLLEREGRRRAVLDTL